MPLDMLGYSAITSLLNHFRSMTDSLFRRDEKKSALEEVKELEYSKHNYRSQEQKEAQERAYKQHIDGIELKGRLDAAAQEKQHRHNEVIQKKDHENKKDLAKQQHDDQMDAIGYRYFLDRENLILSNELQLIRDLVNRQANHANAKEMEEFKVAMLALDRALKRAEEYSPFTDIFPDRLIKNYFEEIIGRRERQPLILIAPFYYDNHPYDAQKKGGLPLCTFNHVIDNAVGKKLSQFVIKRNGHLRPLFHDDRDIDHILPCFPNIPVILIHGRVLGSQVEPIVTIWNFPGCLENSPLSFPLEASLLPSKNSGESIIDFQNYMASKVAELVGMLTDAFHLVVNGKRPNLQRYLINEPEQLKALADELGFYYQLICEAEPNQEPIYRLEQAMMLAEAGLIIDAKKYLDYGIKIWLKMRNAPSISDENITNILLSHITASDSKFVNLLQSVESKLGGLK